MIGYVAFKEVTKIVVALGVGTIVGNAVKATTPIVISKCDKLLIAAGSFVVGSLAGDVAAKYVDKTIDEVVLFAKEFRSKYKQNMKEYQEMKKQNSDETV